jgi:hypothetical protein
MDPSTKVIGKMTWRMDLAGKYFRIQKKDYSTPTEMYSRAIGSTTKPTATVDISTPTVLCTREVGLKTSKRAAGKNHGPTTRHSRAIIPRASKMATENSIGRTVVSTKENFSRTNFVAKVEFRNLITT